MKIKLITQEQYDIIAKIKKENEILTFENDGYEYINPVSDDDKQAKRVVEEILSKHIIGFSEFNNFRDRKDRIQLRIQYDYEAERERKTTSFIGVGYLFLDELLNGFD